MAELPYTTFTGLVIDVLPDNGEFILTIAGDQVKELGRGKEDILRAEAGKLVAQDKKRAETEMRCEECGVILFRKDATEHAREHS